MLDIKQVRSAPDQIDEGLGKRGLKPVAKDILEKDTVVRQLTSELQVLQEKKNEIAKANSSKDRSADSIAQGQEIRDKVAAIESQLLAAQEQLNAVLFNIPNIPSEDAIIGTDENDNVEIRRGGTIPNFDFEPKEHHVLGANLGYLDTDLAAKLSGTRFTVLSGAFARLERSIAQFMLDTHTREHGYSEVSVPILVNDYCMFGTGQLPKFSEDCFHTTEGQWLIPTAEVSLTNLVRNMILTAKQMPIRVTSLTPCFRSEAGSAGRDIKGMFRQRQFYKVELVSIVTPEDEFSEHQRMTESAENILKKLELPYHIVELCTGDMGFSARKTYDIEVWLPGQNRYREISSCSRCGDFQARRMNAKYKTADGKSEFVCTLNGSGLAVGRTLIAVVENFQQADGSIIIPEALRPYMETDKIERGDGSLSI
ncbi:MAG: serine--tRNA ligase [Holosporales bacterium]|jgi:seryl-tRNA synthetase|nr:serine--tRNA ligase [Holosporales bacterium]